MTAEEELKKDQVMIKNVPAEELLISYTPIYHVILRLLKSRQLKIHFPSQKQNTKCKNEKDTNNWHYGIQEIVRPIYS